MAFRLKNNSSGFSLLGAIIGVALVGVFILGYAEINRYRAKALVTSQYANDVLALRHVVRESFSCSETFSNVDAACTEQGAIDLKTHDGKVLIEKVGTKFGHLEAKAQCDVDGHIKVDIRSLPMKNLVLSSKDTVNWKDLFNGIPLTCGRGADICELPQGNSSPVVMLGGEDYPGNDFDPGGGDYDDFFLKVSGDINFERGAPAKIAVASPGTFTFEYFRNLAESDCVHDLKIILRKCPNLDSTPILTKEVAIGFNTYTKIELDVDTPNAFIDIVLTTSPNPSSSYCRGFAPIDFSLLSPVSSPFMNR